MPHSLVHSYYYNESTGPVRNGSSRSKEPIDPSHADICYEDFLSMAETVIEWGQNQYANDHGTKDDHQTLVDFVNHAVKYATVLNT